MTPTLKFVTDPMCSWCWAMTPHIETTLRNFDGRVAFDLEADIERWLSPIGGRIEAN